MRRLHSRHASLAQGEFGLCDLMLDISKVMYRTLNTTREIGTNGIASMITAAQLRAARALIGIDQRELAQRSGLSVPTIQRMEASDGVVRGNVDSLMKLIEAFDASGIELIGEGAVSAGGGRGVRLRGTQTTPKPGPMDTGGA
jgi:DNA-binding XRE family transcriptional regulator